MSAPIKLRITPILALLALLVALPPGAVVAAEQQTLESIVAVVNDDIILASELDEEVELARQQLRQQGQRASGQELRRQVLDSLIDERLQLQRARQFGISVSDEQVNRALQDLAERNDTDLTGLRQRLNADGIDFATIRDDIRTQLILQQLNQRRVASQINIRDEAIDDFLAEQDEPDDGDEIEFRIDHILVTDDDKDAAAERAGEVREQLAAGEDFADLAQQVSAGPNADDGGDLGWRTPDNLPQLFQDALADMTTGEISEPLESANGYHILRLADRRGGETVTEHRTRHILITPDGGGEQAEEQARERVAELRDQLQTGVEFAELAAEHSDDADSAADGGELGWVGPGDVEPAFQEVISELPTDRLSEPFRTEAGWHVAEVTDRRRESGDQERYRRAQAEQQLFRDRVAERTEEWIGELRDEAFIEKRLDDNGG